MCKVIDLGYDAVQLPMGPVRDEIKRKVFFEISIIGALYGTPKISVKCKQRAKGYNRTSC
jgi:hypothetical protein